MKKLNLEGSMRLVDLLKCCIIANYQYKDFEQKGFSRIQSINALSRFEFFCHNCKGNVKELVTVTSYQLVTRFQMREKFENVPRYH